VQAQTGRIEMQALLKYRVGSQPTCPGFVSIGIGEIIGDNRDAILALAAKCEASNMRVRYAQFRYQISGAFPEFTAEVATADNAAA
jgi:hypothetical protein